MSREVKKIILGEVIFNPWEVGLDIRKLEF